MTEIHRNSLESRCDEIKRLVINHCTSDSTVLGIDGLLDALLVLYDECCNVTLKKEKTIVEFLEYVGTFISRIKQCRVNRDDFQTIKTIGRGAFGEVVVVKMKNTEDLFAMKIMDK
ncbi:unnamed protein product, partial [Adineta ricciae]